MAYLERLVFPTPKAKSVTVPLACRLCSLETHASFVVRVELILGVDLLAYTLLREVIGGAGCSPFPCGFHRQIGSCGSHAEGGALTLSGRV